MTNDEIASIKFQIKNDIIEALKNQLNDIKQEIQDLKANYDIVFNSFPKLVNDNIEVALKDYQFLKNNNCFCFKRK